jgi:hypothetical protein
MTDDHETRLLRRGVAALFDASLVDWNQDELDELAEAIKRDRNHVEIRSDGSLVASVGNRIIFESTEAECLSLGAELEAP